MDPLNGCGKQSNLIRCVSTADMWGPCTAPCEGSTSSQVTEGRRDSRGAMEAHLAPTREPHSPWLRRMPVDTGIECVARRWCRTHGGTIVRHAQNEPNLQLPRPTYRTSVAGRLNSFRRSLARSVTRASHVESVASSAVLSSARGVTEGGCHVASPLAAAVGRLVAVEELSNCAGSGRATLSSLELVCWRTPTSALSLTVAPSRWLVSLPYLLLNDAANPSVGDGSILTRPGSQSRENEGGGRGRYNWFYH